MSNKYYEGDRDRILAAYATNPEPKKAASLAYYHAHHEECLQKRAVYREKNRQTLREDQLMRRVGLTYSERDAHFAEQGYQCACCGVNKPGSKHGWYVDHDHNKKRGDPGYIRGVVCHHCNSALHKNATPAWCRAMATYLEAHNG